MGCSSSSGGSNPSSGKREPHPLSKVNFKHVGVHSVDDFLYKTKATLKEFQDLLKPLDDAAYDLSWITRFWWEKKGTLKHSITGIILSIYSSANGDPTKCQIEPIGYSPYFDFKCKGVNPDLDRYIDAFVILVKALEEIVTGQTLKDLMVRIARLPGEAEDIQNHAKGEFEALNAIAKAKAVAAMASDVLEIKKIPDVVTKIVDNFKRDLTDLKNFAEDLKNNQARYLEEGKKCAAAGAILPVPCYKQIYGEIN